MVKLWILACAGLFYLSSMVFAQGFPWWLQGPIPTAGYFRVETAYATNATTTVFRVYGEPVTNMVNNGRTVSVYLAISPYASNWVAANSNMVWTMTNNWPWVTSTISWTSNGYVSLSNSWFGSTAYQIDAVATQAWWLAAVNSNGAAITETDPIFTNIPVVVWSNPVTSAANYVTNGGATGLVYDVATWYDTTNRIQHARTNDFGGSGSASIPSGTLVITNTGSAGDVATWDGGSPSGVQTGYWGTAGSAASSYFEVRGDGHVVFKNVLVSDVYFTTNAQGWVVFK